MNLSYARAKILLMAPLPPFNKVFSLVLQEEQQREILVDSLSFIEVHAFAAKSDTS